MKRVTHTALCIVIIILAVALVGCTDASPVASTPVFTPIVTPVATSSPSPTETPAPCMEPTQPMPMDEGIEIELYDLETLKLRVKYPGGTRYEVVTDHGQYSDEYSITLVAGDINTWIKDMEIKVYDEDGMLIKACCFKNVMFVGANGQKVLDEAEDADEVEMLWIDGSDDLIVRNIEAFKNLLYLDIDGLRSSSIDDFSALHKLHSLAINFDVEMEVDLEAFSGLTCLRSLRLRNLCKKLTNIKALSIMTQLEVLLLDEFKTSNLNFLSEYKNLKELYLSDGEVEDISALTSLEHLKKLMLINIPCKVDFSKMIELEELMTDKAAYLHSLIHLPKLKKLELTDCYDLETLSQMSALRQLKIVLHDTEDTVRIPTMAQLEDLDIQFFGSGKTHMDIRGFKGMQSLRYLSFNGNWDSDLVVEDYSHISYLTNLIEMYMEGGEYNLKQISFLEQLENLEQLSINLYYVNDTSPLKDLKLLKYLKVVGANMLPKLDDLEHLETLRIWCFYNFDAKLIEGLSIKELFLHSCIDIINIEAVDSLENLEELSITWDNTKAVPDFEHLHKLTELVLWDNCLTSLSLTRMENVETLGIASNAIEDITFLANFPKLKTLWAEDTDITDISVLAELKNLEYIDIGYTDVSDISPLATLENLKYLNVEGCSIEDFGAFSDREDIVIVR